MIGLAVMSYNRLDYLKQCIESLDKNNWGGAEVKIVVDDCSNKDVIDYLDTLPEDVIVITKEENKGIGHSKNNGLILMEGMGCDHYFLMEDDILMKDPNTCRLYVRYAEMNKLHHLNFALHGPLNKGRGLTIDGIKVYSECVGAFSYYSRECIDRVGYMDEKFKNAWEHVEHTFRICEEDDLHPPFWMFADCVLNKKLLEEIPGSIDNSSIRLRDDWQKNIEEGKKYFIAKHGRWLPPRG